MCWFHAASLSLSAWRASFCQRINVKSNLYRDLKLGGFKEKAQQSSCQFLSLLQMSPTSKFGPSSICQCTHMINLPSHTSTVQLEHIALCRACSLCHSGMKDGPWREWKMGLGGAAQSIFLIMLFFYCHVKWLFAKASKVVSFVISSRLSTSSLWSILMTHLFSPLFSSWPI